MSGPRWRIGIGCRWRPTRDYFARRLAKGKTKNEIMRCVKRHVAREIYHAVREPDRRTHECVAAK